jgi:hypothetical protein
MKRQERTRPRARVVAVVLAALLGTAAVSRAAEGGGTAEGITVHGHWTIDILNPDGSLDSHHEIENALQTGGAAKLARFLGRTNAPSLWQVYLYSSPGAPNCSSGSPACILSENNHVATGNGNLSVSVPASGLNQDKLVLSGSLTSADARSIFRVLSGVGLCPSGSPGCVPSLDTSFSMKDFAPIAVAAGQIVQVTVVFSFS